MAETVVAGITYRVGKLTPKQQLHVARRIAPLATTFKGSEDEVVAAFTQHIAKMTDAEIDAIVDPCMGVCQRKIADGAWAAICAPGTNQLMYDDINAQGIFELTVAVLKENLGNFFPGQGGAGALASQVRQR